MSRCPLGKMLFFSGVITYITVSRRRSSSQKPKTSDGKKHVIFVLGGPGAGKGTVCERLIPPTSTPTPTPTPISSNHAFFSAGDLLRAERNTNSPTAKIINSKISNGNFVPAEITVGLINKAFSNSKADIFLLDGFPRNIDNVTAWEEVIGDSITIDFVLFLDCPEDIMLGRIIERGRTSNRSDDNLETARKRFANFRKDSMPIVKKFEAQGKVHNVRADRPVDDVYLDCKKLVESNMKAILLL
ncbi:hypothetical protein ScalyP_jg668 [Parmales sp. scaly parma]|nr:hypothetical protein ScalyP_jg668 [Parmales sp. scaly parma]